MIEGPVTADLGPYVSGEKGTGRGPPCLTNFIEQRKGPLKCGPDRSAGDLFLSMTVPVGLY